MFSYIEDWELKIYELNELENDPTFSEVVLNDALKMEKSVKSSLPLAPMNSKMWFHSPSKMFIHGVQAPGLRLNHLVHDFGYEVALEGLAHIFNEVVKLHLEDHILGYL